MAKKTIRDQINDPLDSVKLASDETSTEIFSYTAENVNLWEVISRYVSYDFRNAKYFRTTLSICNVIKSFTNFDGF